MKETLTISVIDNTIVRLDLELTPSQIWQLALFLRRSGYADFRDKAGDDAQAYDMRNAAGVLLEALERAM